MRERQLLADALNRLIEAEAGLDADDEQVERVGQAQADAVLPLPGHAAEHHARQHVADDAPTSAVPRFGRTMSGVDSTTKATQRDAEADAEEDDQRFVAAVAGGDQPVLQLAHLADRLRRDVAEPLQRVDDHLLVAGVDRRLHRARRSTSPSRRSMATDAAPKSSSAAAGDQQRREQEREQRKQQRHDYTSILMNLADPEEADRLHDDRRADQHLAHAAR